MSYLLVQSDARSIPLRDNSVHACVTSPPYYLLRDYGTGRWEGGDALCGHIDERATESKARLKQAHSDDIRNKCPELTGHQTATLASSVQYRSACGKCGARRVDRQIGLEDNIESYVDAMVRVFREVRRVLHPTGTAWVNIGDSYASSGVMDHSSHHGLDAYERRRSGNDNGPKNRRARGRAPMSDGLKPKDLRMIPARVAIALQADGWYLRSEIIWAKLNPMPESVRDRPTRSHEMVYLLSKASRYFYDAESVRGKNTGSLPWGRRRTPDKTEADEAQGPHGNGSIHRPMDHDDRVMLGTNGRNMRSVIQISTESYTGCHYATYPRKLIEPFIKAGTSQAGACPSCGSPWVRVCDVERWSERERKRGTARGWQGLPGRHTEGRQNGLHNLNGQTSGRIVNTLAWKPSCRCPDHDPVPCTILDPFAGSGTTLIVANALGRRAIGLDLSREYLTRDAKRRLDRPHGRALRPERTDEHHPLFPEEPC